MRVRFLRFGASSLDVEVSAYISARDWNQFLEIQEALLLHIMKCTESAGVQIALPSQAIFVAAGSASTEAGMGGVLKAPTPGTRTSGQAPAKSA
jgi:small-conductance mechanosensitive channel